MKMSTRQNFADAFCSRRGIPKGRFVDALLGSALYPHARLILPFCGIFSRNTNMRDRQVLSDVGLATRVEEIEHILKDLPSYYGSEWGLRSAFRVRVSSKRVIRTARKLLAA